MSSNLTARILTAAVGIPVVLAVDYLGGWAFAGLIALTGAAAGAEFYQLMRSANYEPASALALPVLVLVAVWPFLGGHVEAVWIGITLLLLFAAGMWYLAPFAYAGGLPGWLCTVGGVLYVGILLGHLSLLRSLPDGGWWVLAALVMTWAYDTGAYAAGRSYGRRPFMAHISPKKTVEGVLGGLALCMVSAFITVPTVGVAAWQAPFLGLAVGVVAQVADLIESMIKRQVGAKDSGILIPGHGGVLDRIDALLFTGALTYYAALALGHAP